MTGEPRWWINESWLLAGLDIQRLFTEDAWALESWPPCPACGGMVTAEYVPTPDLEGGWTFGRATGSAPGPDPSSRGVVEAVRIDDPTDAAAGDLDGHLSTAARRGYRQVGVADRAVHGLAVAA